MGKYTDLHCHSTYSDGTLTLEQIFERAQKNNLSSIVVTDHDTIIEHQELKNFSEKYKVLTIPGVEISCYFEEKEIHVLAYNFDPTNAQLLNVLDSIKVSRKERAYKIISNINAKYGYCIDASELDNEFSYYGRPQIADLLVKRKISKSVKHAFVDFLGNNNDVVVPKKKITVKEIIKIVKQAGGVTVLAHYGKYKDIDMLNKLIDYEIDGIEVFHPSHTEKLSKELLHFCKKNNLLITGGSDYHGLSLKSPDLGGLSLSDSYYQSIINR